MSTTSAWREVLAFLNLSVFVVRFEKKDLIDIAGFAYVLINK